MKLVKMSLLAATLIASSAFAIDNVKVSGDAKLYYSTNDTENLTASGEDKGALFAQVNSAGQAALGLGVTADLTEGVSAGVHMTALTSLGLYNNLVANVWEGTPEDEYWFDEAWVAGTVGKTTGKIGRMTLDTPMVFSETWSTATNTFEAAVLLNQDIPDTTLVAAYVGQSNSGGLAAAVNGQTVSGFAGVTADFENASANTNFGSFYQGAYAFGAVNNSWEPLTVQAWYFHAQHLLSAYWLQADLNIIGLDFGAQYTSTKETAALSDETNDAFAVKVGYEMKDVFAVSAAYSQTGDKISVTQTGANLAGYGQSKLYTEAWWNYGYITMTDTSAYNVTASTPEALTWVELGLFLTQSTTANGNPDGSDLEMTEVTLSASKSFGPLDASLVYIMTDADDQNIKAGDTKGSAFNTVQAYLTYNF